MFNDQNRDYDPFEFKNEEVKQMDSMELITELMVTQVLKGVFGID